jgi:hypothetical protein
VGAADQHRLWLLLLLLPLLLLPLRRPVKEAAAQHGKPLTSKFHARRMCAA